MTRADPARTPSRALDDAKRLALLTSRVARLTCSQRWTLDLVDRIAAGELPFRTQTEAQARALSNVAAYPPGGKTTRMVRCAHCHHWTPPQSVGSSGVCEDCFMGQLAPHLAAQYPSAIIYTQRISRAHAIDAGLYPQRSSSRRRFLADNGTIREETQTEDGRVSQIVIELPEPPAAAAERTAAAAA